MTVTLTPRHADATGDRDDHDIVVNKTKIGGVYFCGAGYVADDARWASYGPAGLRMGFPTRDAAIAAQMP